ncbi:MAG TPA: rhamnulokinase family protein [Trebonia sp.]|jgi:rhamnulokinase|nr:rhamnulokinase family protein [Trebonia sp.]
MTSDVVVAAVDLGASGGRVIAARVSRGSVGDIELREVSRFPNEPVLAGGTLHWDILRLYGDVLSGLTAAAARFPLAGAGIDSWGCDYGLLDASGALLGNPVHYRDARTDGLPAPVPLPDLYAATGIQHLPFNTVYQLAAARGTPVLGAAATLLMIPDLLAYWLTGSVGAEVTNASTTALLDVATRKWATGLIGRAGIDPGLFPALRQPGDVIGLMTRTGTGAQALSAVPLVTVGSHDTASAVAAVPADGPDFAYISSGTWSLVGMELTAPVLTRASLEANFTNEAGIDGTIRYLRNVTGLWLLQECLRHWGQAAPGSAAPSLDSLLDTAAAVEPLRFVIDADDPVFLPPGNMPGRITDWLSTRGLPVPGSPPEVVRCVLDSLALAYRRALTAVQELSGRHADVVHVVGGGSRNELLCQLTADAAGLPVVAGPAEAAALGNVLVQARALGAAPGDLRGLRALLRAGLLRRDLRVYAPSVDDAGWASAARRVLTGEVTRSL